MYAIDEWISLYFDNKHANHRLLLSVFNCKENILMKFFKFVLKNIKRVIDIKLSCLSKIY